MFHNANFGASKIVYENPSFLRLEACFSFLKRSCNGKHRRCSPAWPPLFYLLFSPVPHRVSQSTLFTSPILR